MVDFTDMPPKISLPLTRKLFQNALLFFFIIVYKANRVTENSIAQDYLGTQRKRSSLNMHLPALQTPIPSQETLSYIISVKKKSHKINSRHVRQQPCLLFSLVRNANKNWPVPLLISNQLSECISFSSQAKGTQVNDRG